MPWTAEDVDESEAMGAGAAESGVDSRGRRGRRPPPSGGADASRRSPSSPGMHGGQPAEVEAPAAAAPPSDLHMR